MNTSIRVEMPVAVHTPVTAVDAVVQRIQQRLDRPVGRVIVIGAGEAEMLEAWLALRPQHVVLIEGDPDRAEALRRRVARRRDVSVESCVVSADGAPTRWRRFTLPALDGPIGTERLSKHLPRVRTLSIETRESVKLASILDRVALGQSDGFSHVLVLDVAGQESLLLDAVSRDRLAAFDFIVISGCRVSLDGVVPTCSEVVERLTSGFLVLEGVENRAAPLWPTVVLRVDRTRLELSMLRERLTQAESDRALADSAREEALRTIEHMRQASAEQDAALEASRRDACEQGAALAQLRLDFADVQALATERLGRIESMERLYAALGARMDDVSASHGALTALIEAQQATFTATVAERERSGVELERYRLEGDTLRLEIDALRTERDGLNAGLAEADACRRDLEERWEVRDGEIAELRAMLDAARATVTERECALENCRRELEAKEQEASQLERELAHSAARTEDVRQACQDVEARLAAAMQERVEAVNQATRMREEVAASVRLSEDAAARASASEILAAEHQSRIATLLSDLDATRAECRRAEQSAALAVRLITLRENDLADLRNRYAILDRRDRDRECLLAALAQRLHAAAGRLVAAGGSTSAAPAEGVGPDGPPDTPATPRSTRARNGTRSAARRGTAAKP